MNENEKLPVEQEKEESFLMFVVHLVGIATVLLPFGLLWSMFYPLFYYLRTGAAKVVAKVTKMMKRRKSNE